MKHYKCSFSDNKVHDWFSRDQTDRKLGAKEAQLGGGGGKGGVLWISSDGDDRMGAKIITQKKIPGPKINPQKIPCRISEP